MGGGLPKPLRRLGGKTLLGRVADQLLEAGITWERLVIVVSPGFDKSKAELSGEPAQWVIQPEAKGTGDAARLGLESVGHSDDVPVIIALADVPFTSAASFQGLLTTDKDLAFVSAEVQDPGTLGRVLRDAQGHVLAIIEAKELTKDQGPIREINVGHFGGLRDILIGLIAKIQPLEQGGEVYLTETVRLAKEGGLAVGTVKVAESREVLAANTPEELIQLEEAYAHGSK